MKLTKLFLEGAYPSEEGWKFSTEAHVDGIRIAYILRNGQFSVVVPALSYEPYVTGNQILAAKTLKKRFAKNNVDTHVQIVLIYGKLLMPPFNLPKDIVVLSMTEDCDESIKRESYDVCQN